MRKFSDRFEILKNKFIDNLCQTGTPMASRNLPPSFFNAHYHAKVNKKEKQKKVYVKEKEKNKVNVTEKQKTR